LPTLSLPHSHEGQVTRAPRSSGSLCAANGNSYRQLGWPDLLRPAAVQGTLFASRTVNVTHPEGCARTEEPILPDSRFTRGKDVLPVGRHDTRRALLEVEQLGNLRNPKVWGPEDPPRKQPICEPVTNPGGGFHRMDGPPTAPDVPRRRDESPATTVAKVIVAYAVAETVEPGFVVILKARSLRDRDKLGCGSLLPSRRETVAQPPVQIDRSTADSVSNGTIGHFGRCPPVG